MHTKFKGYAKEYDSLLPIELPTLRNTLNSNSIYLISTFESSYKTVDSSIVSNKVYCNIKHETQLYVTRHNAINKAQCLSFYS